METVKDFLFDAFGIVGVIALILIAIWLVLLLLDRLFRFSKYIVKYCLYARKKELYDRKDTVVVAKDGEILRSYIYDLDEEIRALNRAIERCNKLKEMQERLSIKK